MCNVYLVSATASKEPGGELSGENNFLTVTHYYINELLLVRQLLSPQTVRNMNIIS